MHPLIRTARATGLFYLGLAVAPLLGTLVVRPRLFAPDNPAATLANLAGHDLLARCGVALGLAGVVAQALVALWFFRLFRSVDPFLAGAIAVFGLVNAVAMLIDTTELGYFVFAMTTVEKFVEIVYTLPRALLPSLTQIVALGDRERLHLVFGQAFRLVQVVACILCFGLFVYARELVLLVGSPLFEPAIPLLRVLALVPLVRTAQQPLTMLFQATSRTVHVLHLALVKLGAEALGYLVMLLLPHAWRAQGACWANLEGAVAAFAGAMLLARLVLREGSAERTGVVLRSALLMGPLLLATLAADRWLGPALSLAVRVPLLATMPDTLGMRFAAAPVPVGD